MILWLQWFRIHPCSSVWLGTPIRTNLHWIHIKGKIRINEPFKKWISILNFPTFTRYSTLTHTHWLSENKSRMCYWRCDLNLAEIACGLSSPSPVPSPTFCALKFPEAFRWCWALFFHPRKSSPGAVASAHPFFPPGLTNLRECKRGWSFKIIRIEIKFTFRWVGCKSGGTGFRSEMEGSPATELVKLVRVVPAVCSWLGFWDSRVLLVYQSCPWEERTSSGLGWFHLPTQSLRNWIYCRTVCCFVWVRCLDSDRSEGP